MENWPQRETTPYGVASAAWAGYLAQGPGLTIVDTRKTYAVPTGLGHAISIAGSAHALLHCYPHRPQEQNRRVYGTCSGLTAFRFARFPRRS